MADRDYLLAIAERLQAGDLIGLGRVAMDMAVELRALEERREKDAERKRNSRKKGVENSPAVVVRVSEMSADSPEKAPVSADSADIADGPPPLPSRSSPTPPSNSSFSPPASSSVGPTDVENVVEKWESPAEERVAQKLETAPDRQAFRQILEAAPNRYAWAAECSASLDGMHGPALTGRALGAILRDYVGNGDHASPSFKHFRAYLRRPDREPAPGAGETGNQGPAAGAPQRGATGQGEASLIVAQILALKRRNAPPGQAVSEYIRRAEVGLLAGPEDSPASIELLTAYDAVGGAARFLETGGRDHSFLVRDFAEALKAARAGAQLVTVRGDGQPPTLGLLRSG